MPVAQGMLAMHFGHCEAFALLAVAKETKAVSQTQVVPASPHQPGLLPRRLAEQGAQVIIAGGMGSRAQGLFAECGVEVIVGAPVAAPEDLAAAYTEGNLTTGGNVCDH